MRREGQLYVLKQIHHEPCDYYTFGDKLVLEDQLRAMCHRLYAAGLNIDYYPTSFIPEKGTLYYIDYECNGYMEQWNFENWGCKYWSKTPEFLAAFAK